MAVDLHIHSIASDGAYDAATLVQMGAYAGLVAMAIADHDSVGSVAAARAEAKRRGGLRVLPAVELSARADDGRSVHVLGYCIDPHSGSLQRFLSDQRAERVRRAERMVASLASAGFPISMDAVLAHANGGSVGRTHVALALVDNGAVPSVGAAFTELIGRGRPHYVPKDVPDAAAVIDLVHEAGGLAVIAHPAVSGVLDLIDTLIAAGLDGIEAYHAQHTHEQRLALARLAMDRGLVATGGSDFHGHPGDTARLGAGDAPDTVIAEIVARAESRACHDQGV
ncbi:PHP domain-containing protein [Coriobacteriia bacterium Es71-Z0120]|uniref:PHP domain-containing protein n=1 Tax=Parvivirga hydrogeniphila TaxID=2939460 RepID=UPI002260FD88|nr:PHP domain-containing protein [Parvivirga hydrogeniphila]MCL4079625.1 PHP domain-containing protein [Parvivirga hydrogeniphila]